MRHMLEGENLGLITHKREELNLPWRHAFVTSFITEHGVLSSKPTNYHFPLYIYQSKEENNPRSGSTIMMVFEPKAKYQARKPNIDQKIYETLESVYNKKLTPEEILYFIYGIFYSNKYRTKYAEFLKIDFPRVPFTANYELFKNISQFGKQLTELHLLKSDLLNTPVAKYQGSGKNDRIEKIKYSEKDQRIYINNEKYFEGITPEVWNYYIGGYRVCHKWLKDRKAKLLSLTEVELYCRIVTAIYLTIDVQRKIDQIYEDVEYSILVV